MKVELGAILLTCAGVLAWDCKTKLDNINYNLSALDGDYEVSLKHNTPPTTKHTVYAISPCGTLPRNSKLKDDEQCKSGTSVCRTTKVERDDTNSIIEVVAFAANSKDAPKPEISRLSGDSDKGSNGLRLHLFGGMNGDGEEQSTVIDFICDENEKLGEPVFVIDESGLVKFKWHTRHACAHAADDTPDNDTEPKRPSAGSSWGFFTWFFLIVFMLIAAFLIFTLFLNYNRYGQVGLDLVPAMDSVKDIPYLFKDFASQVVETLKGSGGRSGYSAV